MWLWQLSSTCAFANIYVFVLFLLFARTIQRLKFYHMNMYVFIIFLLNYYWFSLVILKICCIRGNVTCISTEWILLPFFWHFDLFMFLLMKNHSCFGRERRCSRLSSSSSSKASSWRLRSRRSARAAVPPCTLALRPELKGKKWPRVSKGVWMTCQR